MGKNQHVVQNDDGSWGVLGEGNSKLTSKHKTQKDAIKAGKERAKNQKSELLIHGTDRKIRDKRSYGNDPNPPKG